VLDACAGAGGKSLHIGVLQKNRGEIIASDIEYQRLKELPIRAKRSGITTIRTVQLSGKATPSALPEQLERVKASCDAVIIDAPCSGMGTVRRMPMTKWRLTPELLRKHGQKQLEILQSFSHAVKDDGILLYSTCSLMPQENQHVVRAFLDQHPEFTPEALAPAFAENGVRIPALSNDAAMLTLTPAQHGTDGFFMARLRRKE
jgi:16S rRNA (cytosine967-C5)-methyltransferase